MDSEIFMGWTSFRRRWQDVTCKVWKMHYGKTARETTSAQIGWVRQE